MVERMKSWSMYFLGCISLLVNAGVELKPYIKRLMSGFYNSILMSTAGSLIAGSFVTAKIQSMIYSII